MIWNFGEWDRKGGFGIYKKVWLIIIFYRAYTPYNVHPHWYVSAHLLLTIRDSVWWQPSLLPILQVLQTITNTEWDHLSFCKTKSSNSTPDTMKNSSRIPVVSYIHWTYERVLACVSILFPIFHFQWQRWLSLYPWNPSHHQAILLKEWVKTSLVSSEKDLWLMYSISSIDDQR